MNAVNNITRLVEDLAGQWTEPLLDILKAAGIRRLTVEMEVEAWRTLQKELRAELHWQRTFRSSTLVSLGALMEQVLRKAARSVVRTFAPEPASQEFVNRISHLVAGRRSTEAERRLYSALIRRPGLRAAFKEPTRTDFVPRLRVSVAAG